MTAVQRLVVGAAAVVASAFVAAMVVLPAMGSPVVGVVSNWTQLVVPLVTAAVCADSARRQNDRRQRRVWVLLGAGAFSWGVGQCVFTWYELALATPVPVPSVADVAFILYPVLGTAAIWLLPQGRRSRAVSLRAVLDGLVIGSSLMFVTWALSLRLLWASGDGDVASLIVTTSYVVIDMVLLTMVMLLLPDVERSRRHVLVPVALGTAAFTVADIGYVVATSSTTYMSGEVFDVGWVLGFLGVAVAAVMAHPGPGGPAATSPARDDHAQPSWGSILLPYVPVVGAPVVLVVRITGTHAWTPAETLLVASTIVLVLARQFVALADNRSLLAAVSGQHAQARHDALHDTLTGLANRALFLDRVAHALSRADRTGGSTAVLFCDLDGFKEVNDVHGHAAGDRVLQAVAHRLQAAVRSVDCVARLGGDEFAVLLEDPTEPHLVVARMERAAAAPVPVAGGVVHPRLSAGIAQAEAGAGVSTDDLVQQADHAMYRVKQARRRGAPRPVPHQLPPGGATRPEVAPADA